MAQDIASVVSASMATVRSMRESLADDDIVDDVDRGQGSSASPMTSKMMSSADIGSSHERPAHPPPNRDPVLAARGLPDYTALLAAELEAAARAANKHAVSPLGVGEVVLSARELTGISQRHLAARAETTQASVTAIESGKRLPTVRMLMRLVGAAGLELVVGLRKPGAPEPIVVGALVPNDDDGLADFLPIRTLSPFDGPRDR
jgi:transcriptional regulator with XRE-family HTH domain